MLFLDKMVFILVLCRVLLIAGVQTLTIDSELGTSIEDCFERIAIGEQLPSDAIYRNVSELTTRECEQLCKQDKKCQAYDYGVGAKGNATCDLSTLDEKSIKENNPLQRHPDYDVYIRRFQCEQSPPTPIQTQYDDPEPGPAHRPVYRPTGEEKPLADDYLVSGDLGYRPPASPDRPDDIYNTGPDFGLGPSYGSHKPPDMPYRPNRPNDKFRPERPNDQRPHERPQKPSSDVLHFNGPRPEYQPEKPNYHYIIRPNRRPRPDFQGQFDGYGQPLGPVGPPDRPYKPDRPYDKPTYSYNSQYASNYGQNYDNSIYVEINDPPRPYVPIKDRPNQQYYGEGYLGYGTYSSQNSYSHNNQYSGSITEIGFGQNKPHERPQKPQNSGYGSNGDYGTSGYNTQSNKPSYGNQNYGSNQGSYGGNQGNYDSTQISYNGDKGSSSSQSNYNTQGSYGNRPDPSNYGETGYGSKPDNPYQTQYGGQSSHQGSYSNSNFENHNYGNHHYETHKPAYNQGYGQSGYQKPQKPIDKPHGNQDPYGSSQYGHVSNQVGYGNQVSHIQSGGSYYGSSQGNYGNQGYSPSGYGNNQGNGIYGYGGYGSQSAYGSGSESSYGMSSSQYGSYYQGNYLHRPVYNDRPDYDNRPDYEERPGYGQRPSHNGQLGYGGTPIYEDNRPGYGGSSSGYGQKPSNQRPGYGESNTDSLNYVQRPSNTVSPGYGETKPGGSTKPGYGDNKPSYGESGSGYGQNSSGQSNSGYGTTKPGDSQPSYGGTGSDDTNTNSGYGQASKPSNQSYRPDVRPVYEYEIDKPNNVPAYIVKPGGQVVISRPVVIGDYERPVYKEPGRISYEACFKRVLAGQRALRSFVQRVVPCERLEDCRRECATERRFHCESFNYRLDPSFRGKGLCELMTKPIESFDLFRDFVQDKDYDFYEVDRNSLEPNCPETLRGPGFLHSGFLSSKDRVSRPNSVEGWRDRNWDRGSGFSYNNRHKGGNRRHDDRFYVPYQIGQARTDNDNEKWGQNGVYGGSSYYKNRNDYHKSISYWGLTSDKPYYGVKPYIQNHFSDKDFDYDTLGKDHTYEIEKDFWPRDRTFIDHYLSKSDHSLGTGEQFLGKSEHFPGKDETFKDFDYHSLGRDDGKEYHLLGEDFYGLKQRYGSGSWRRWNNSGITNVFNLEDHSLTFYDPVDRSDGPSTKDCFSRRKPGMSLSSGSIRRSLLVDSVLACEAACFEEKEFKCVSYSYRYSNSQRSANCFLSERPFTGLSLSADSGSDVYAMPRADGCVTTRHTPWIESECFYHVRSDTAVSGAAVKATLTVAGLGACEAECIRADGFFCRGFSFRFDPPTSDSVHNCILTSSPPTSLSGGEARGHELYARGNYGRGCEPAIDVREEGESCYLQYDKAARLTPSATRGLARVDSEKACSNICDGASFKCLSFSYNNNALPGKDNCLLSEIRLFDLQRDVDYVHSDTDWLFAFDLFNEKCYRGAHTDSEPTFEVPHPIIHSSEEDDSFLPLPPASGPVEPPFTSGSSGGHIEKYNFSPGSSEIHYPFESYRPGSGPSFKPNRPDPEPSFKPSYGSESTSDFRPPDSEGYKPFRPDSYGPGFKPDRPKPGYGPPGPFKPGFRPEGYPKPDNFRPGLPGYGEKPGYGDRPGYSPGDKRPGEKPVYQGDREGGQGTWRHYTVSGLPCRTGTTCAQNVVAGHWACEPEGGEIGSWDYCCAPSHRCGYSEGFHKPWCYVGPKEDQWRPCSEKYYPYHQHNGPHPSQGTREDSRPSSTRPYQSSYPHYIPHWDKRPGPYLSEADRKYWDDLYENGPKAYYDKYGNPLPGYSRVPMEDRPRIRDRHNNHPAGSWSSHSQEDPGVHGLGAPRYWPVAYLHKSPPPNMTYFRYNETKPTTTTEKHTTTPPTLSRELPSKPRLDEPNDLDAKSSRDDKKINITENINQENYTKDDNNTDVNTNATEIEEKTNLTEVEAMKTESYKALDKIEGIDDKLDDFSKSIEVFNIEDVKGDKIADLKSLEEERQIEAIGRLLAARRGTKLVLEKRSQKEIETKNIAVDKDLVEFNFGNKFPTEKRPERRGVIKRISKDEIERDRADKSLEVSETTFVRPPRVLSTTESIRKAVINGKVFYDATIREQRDLFNVTNKNKEPPFVTKAFRNQRDLITTRRPNFKRESLITQENRKESQRTAKSLNIEEKNKNSNYFVEKLVSKPKIRQQNLTIARENSTKNRREELKDVQAIARKPKITQNSTFTSATNATKKLLEESSAPSLINNSNFGKRKTLIARNVNPIRRVRRVYRKRYNPEEVRKRLLERDRNKTSTESSKVV